MRRTRELNNAREKTRLNPFQIEGSNDRKSIFVMFAFSRRKSTIDLYPHIRRICDLTTPNLATKDTGRSEDRFNRTIPTLMCPWEDGHPLLADLTVCLTSDLGDRGVGLVLTEPCHAESVLIGYWIGSSKMCEPSFFLGEVQRNQPIGGGFWILGIELTEFANTCHRDVLTGVREFASKLLPTDSMTSLQTADV